MDDICEDNIDEDAQTIEGKEIEKRSKAQELYDSGSFKYESEFSVCWEHTWN